MLQPYDLRCEYAENPLGIGTSKPRLFWKLTHPERNQNQSAYQIRAAKTSEALAAGNLLWDSGKVTSSESVAIEWGGEPLASRDRVYWQVQCWDKNDIPGSVSEIAWFEVALLEKDDWLADWVGYPLGWIGQALYFRYDLRINRPVTRARMYVSGIGYHELFVNGQRVGNDQLDPAYTDISKRVMYRTFDVADKLADGANVLAATVANGWHGCPRMILQFELFYADGTSEIHATQYSSVGLNMNWLVTCGPVQQNSIYAGETYDAREEKPGWNLPNVELQGRWMGTVPFPSPGGVMTAQMIDPIREMQSLKPKSITKLENGFYVVDLGQNIAGWAQIKVRGERGQTVVLRFAEMLYEDGTVNQENLRDFLATDTYILKGEGEEVWEPRFTYHGFRYVQVEGYPGDLTTDDITGKVVRSSVKTAGHFNCSSELLNRIHEMIWWTEQDNYHSIPTDCPQRNERMGWLNDLVARDEEALYNFDLSNFMPKWIADIHDSQDFKTGGVPLTAPRGWLSAVDPTEPVTVSYLELAWLLYTHYGDKRTLQNCYYGLQRWLDRMEAQADDYIIYYAPVADWAPPIDKICPGTQLSGAPAELMATGFYYHGAKLLEHISSLLGKSDDSAKYAGIASDISQAFNKKFWNDEVKGYGTNNQSCNCFALRLGLVADENRIPVLQNIVKDVVDIHDTHLTTGNVCTKYLLEALSSNGRADIALKLAEQTTYPSWGYMLANGATTVWERWELETSGGMNSHNHPMMASVGSWFFKVLAGINTVPDSFAWDHINLQPRFVAGLDYVTASHDTVRGTIKSSWRREGKQVIVNVDVPVGCTAEYTLSGVVSLTDCEGVKFRQSGRDVVVLSMGSGAYEFIVG